MHNKAEINNKKKKKRCNMFLLILAKIFVWPGITLLYRLKYHYAPGVKNRKIKGRAVIACNHTSYMDALIMQIAWVRRTLHILTASETIDNFRRSWFLRKTGAIRIDRNIMDIEAIRNVIEHLQEGRVVVVMPEGHISKTKRLKPFKTGMFLMALKGGAPVYPTYVSTPKIFRRTHVYIGNPIMPDMIEAEAKKTGEKPVNLFARLTYETMSGFESSHYGMLAKKEFKKKQRWEYIEARPGNRIRVKRPEGYYHYGIYVSDNEVIHFSGNEGDMVNMPDKVEVRSDTLDFFLANNNLEVKVCRWGEKRKQYKPDKIISRARSSIGQKGYDLIKNNCEHFVNFCATGLKISSTDALQQ